MTRRGARWMTCVLVALLTACDSGGDPGSIAASLTSAPIRVMTGPTAKDVTWFTARSVVPGERWWSGLTTFETTRPIEITEARMLRSDEIEPIAILVARNHEDGLPGAISPDQPGANKPGHPSPAVGYELEPGIEYVVYAVASLRDGHTTGEIIGVELGFVDEAVVVVTPIVLCTDPEPSDDCRAAEQRTSEQTSELLGA